MLGSGTNRLTLRTGKVKMSEDSARMEISGVGDIPDAKPSKHRAVALDVLRGLAVLMMVFSGQVPYDKPLPAWLFHAQEPPTYDQNHLIVHVFDPTHAGLTYVDLVFPIFLFCLGAAIPLSLTNKLEQGMTRRQAILGGLWRLMQLSWFAVYIGNIRPVNLHVVPNLTTWMVAFVGCLLMYPMFMRLPAAWDNNRKLLVRLVGYGGGLLLLAALDSSKFYPKHLGFELFRVDVIIVALGDMAFFGTLIWVLTRRSLFARLGVLTFLLAIRLGASQPGWLQEVWTFAPKNTGFVFAFDYLKYLFLVVPGTVAGDLIQEWITKNDAIGAASKPRLLLFIALTTLLVVGLLYGYESRLLYQTSLFSAVCSLGLSRLMSKPSDSLDRLCRTLTHWGIYWLMLGVLLQPFEGGIKKDPSTLCYYFLTAGIAYLLLTSFLILTDVFKTRRPLSLLAYSGQNPMIAYVSMANFILPVLAITHLLPALNSLCYRPWERVLLAALETLLLAYLVSLATKKGIYWRT